ncbi:ABC transporter ATP-binding protein [Niallia circulans]|jgi:putative ABC transport system ATP-binding protein|uniref:Macrolide ABC transporter ATP-binding protein n=1 Tax=Niallia circulans TaxID=1397 RepID=A0A0J1KQE3_NIACI|nr:ABC transporter ATP-binding protein [Niallia circulans]KLV18905.1 macrolide ABC transporter ATP-binding protein [Niallia circulans]MDR4316973.1 ABC transporter ATP-binding protein [Niallia circulans]MED3837951.1 ABC transporter ATP-binding protein [Niallia circulans]MED4241718.1 ABC transporter ATP-binding protein [Niallia circulans]MED4247351.1 ABC transporter ATP-binding protein [Niallia circulans]
MIEQHAIVEIKNVKKEYTLGGETVTALDNVSFTVNKGDFIAIIGPSGSGKSTLMNMIGCLDTPDSGEYYLDGQNVFSLKSKQLAEVRNHKIGFIFQSFNLLTKQSAFENVELPLVYRGIGSKERKEIAMQALKKVGLLERAGHKPTELSGGQQQRVAIARALAGNPPILLADEPTGALDSKTGVEVMNLMKDLNRQGHTIILITHDLQIAKQAKRVIRIQDGRLAETKEVVVS